ncbi:MAG TPA: hypothetical protein PLR76_01235 [Hyphomonas sp.]|nr:hypothetical protein [Hyphomonas sp.]MCA8903404.1 hypothetical protein [Hyphomonas sp.]MCB9970845.1 hypothetical protein [Hyphomonas sp.]HPE46980.1 hypothetical protein [Hyphomonas sp.]
MRKALIGWAGGILLVACANPPPVQTAAINPNDATTSMEGQVSPDGTVIVCRSIKQTGSRFPLHECKSEKAWAKFDAMTKENAKTAIDKIQRNGCPGTPGNC